MKLCDDYVLLHFDHHRLMDWKTLKKESIAEQNEEKDPRLEGQNEAKFIGGIISRPDNQWHYEMVWACKVNSLGEWILD